MKSDKLLEATLLTLQGKLNENNSQNDLYCFRSNSMDIAGEECPINPKWKIRIKTNPGKGPKGPSGRNVDEILLIGKYDDLVKYLKSSEFSGEEGKNYEYYQDFIDSIEPYKEEKIEDNKKVYTESVSWNYYDKFNDILDKYLPDSDEGNTTATQIVTAINKLIYKWYNDGDVYDNVNSSLEGWANDITDYANWLYKYVDGTQDILTKIYDAKNDSDYEDILKRLADKFLTEEYLEQANKAEKKGTIYECEGPFEFNEHTEDWEDEEYY